MVCFNKGWRPRIAKDSSSAYPLQGIADFLNDIASTSPPSVVSDVLANLNSALSPSSISIASYLDLMMNEHNYTNLKISVGKDSHGNITFNVTDKTK